MLLAIVIGVSNAVPAIDALPFEAIVPIGDHDCGECDFNSDVYGFLLNDTSCDVKFIITPEKRANLTDDCNKENQKNAEIVKEEFLSNNPKEACTINVAGALTALNDATSAFNSASGKVDSCLQKSYNFSLAVLDAQWARNSAASKLQEQFCDKKAQNYTDAVAAFELSQSKLDAALQAQISLKAACENAQKQKNTADAAKTAADGFYKSALALLSDIKNLKSLSAADAISAAKFASDCDQAKNDAFKEVSNAKAANDGISIPADSSAAQDCVEAANNSLDAANDAQKDCLTKIEVVVPNVPVPEKVTDETTEPEVVPENKATEPTEPEVVPENKATEPTKPEVVPENKATEPTKPEVVPENKATEPTEPEVVPENKVTQSTEAATETTTTTEATTTTTTTTTSETTTTAECSCSATPESGLFCYYQDPFPEYQRKVIA